MNNLYRKIAHKLCKISGCNVYSIDYKTGADLTYPSLHDECFNAYVKLLDSLGDVIAVGDSFGANLLLSTCLRLRDKNIRLPKAIICISCYIDLAASGESYRKNCYADPSYCLPRTLKTTKSSLERSLRIAATRRHAINTSRLHMPSLTAFLRL